MTVGIHTFELLCIHRKPLTLSYITVPASVLSLQWPHCIACSTLPTTTFFRGWLLSNLVLLQASSSVCSLKQAVPRSLIPLLLNLMNNFWCIFMACREHFILLTSILPCKSPSALFLCRCIPCVSSCPLCGFVLSWHTSSRTAILSSSPVPSAPSTSVNSWEVYFQPREFCWSPDLFIQQSTEHSYFDFPHIAKVCIPGLPYTGSSCAGYLTEWHCPSHRWPNHEFTSYC